jgi:hypothetical protein
MFTHLCELHVMMMGNEEDDSNKNMTMSESDNELE